VLGKGLDLAGVAFKASIGAAMAGGAAAVGVGMKSVTAAANFEQTKVAFATLIGDAPKAEETLARLRELGAETPFEFPELADAGRKLIAFGESADSVPDTLRRIGDISAGVQAPINEIAELCGKARVQGRLFGEDINQLTGRGIPIIQELAKQFGVSDSQVKKLVETGKVGFPNIERAFIDMTSEGGKFAGMMAAQSTNLITDMGMWAGLGKLMFGTMLIAVGEIVKAFESLVSFLAAGMEWVGRLLLQQLLRIPGMDKLFGFGAEDVGTDFGQIHAAYKSQDSFGGGKLGAWGADMAGSGAGSIAEIFLCHRSSAVALMPRPGFGHPEVPFITTQESWLRDKPAEARELNDIGNIATLSGPAPELAGGRNWLLNGVTQTP
jgi:tape measure domain-containing protein